MPRKVTATTRMQIMTRDNYKCVLCGRSANIHNVVLQVDHIIPVAEGGTDNVENLQTLCQECNIGKSNYIYTSTPQLRYGLLAINEQKTRSGTNFAGLWVKGGNPQWKDIHFKLYTTNEGNDSIMIEDLNLAGLVTPIFVQGIKLEERLLGGWSNKKLSIKETFVFDFVVLIPREYEQEIIEMTLKIRYKDGSGQYEHWLKLFNIDLRNGQFGRIEDLGKRSI